MDCTSVENPYGSGICRRKDYGRIKSGSRLSAFAQKAFSYGSYSQPKVKALPAVSAADSPESCRQKTYTQSTVNSNFIRCSFYLINDME